MRRLSRLAAGATAALPGSGPFAGTTSLHSINGFADIVSFNSSGGGRILRKFTFSTLGCFGSGAFPVGTDPYGDPTNTAVIRSIAVKPTGTFILTTKPTLPEAEGTVTTAVIQGAFASTKSVSGTITISQIGQRRHLRADEDEVQRAAGHDQQPRSERRLSSPPRLQERAGSRRDWR